MKNNSLQLITLKDLELDDYNDRANEIAEAAWPEFMLYDPVAGEHWHELYERFGEYQSPSWIPQQTVWQPWETASHSIGKNPSKTSPKAAGTGSF